MIKILIRKITLPNHRDFIRYRLIKVVLYVKLCVLLESLLVTNKKIVACLINEKNLEKKIKVSFLIFEYHRLYGSFININKTRKYYLKLISKQEFIEKNISEIISAKIELGDFSKVKERFFNSRESIIRTNQKLLIDFFENKNNKNLDIINKKFFKMINNKSIAVVGPANPLENNGKEIDSFDYIVRINILLSDKSAITLDETKTGLKTDIIYYNDDMVRRWEETIMSLKSNTWNVFKNKKNSKKYIDKTKRETCSTQTTLDFLRGSTTAGSMMVPNILFDLLKYNPKKIKVFNVDFYYDGFNYMDDYKKKINIERNVAIFSKELRKHDAFFNYQLIKNFLNNKKIQIDKMGMRPMIISDKGYADRLDNFFSKYTY